MPLLAYVAIILVSVGGILFEVNWLTSPKLEPKAAVQASATAAPPKVAEAAIAPRSEGAPAPRNVAPTVTMVPAASSTATTPVAPAAAAAASEPTTPPQPAEPATKQAGTAPAISPAPFGVANAATPANTTAASPGVTTAAPSTDFKREFTTDTKATDGKAVDEKSASAASAATFTPAVATSASAVAASSNNKCDIASCSAAYQSFRASDCTYQPIDGTARKVCDRAPETAQRASAPVRDPRIEAATRKPSKDAELRAVEREVRRMTASEAALDPGERRLDRSLDRNLLDRGFDRSSGGSEVIVIERPNRDW